ncbi:MFS transporter [Sphingobium sp. BYY-5]|uniref:MFS transporter n=1 Tax=Sphingobium sp. BYY-5 TaxID=2926400 RepID=UPI001FA7827A|nr:MFS transporter [Sphingobium sp. BYY-5]MCI4592031.1 MFS transporter [Sphingobium sp. BYY-5]
MAGSFAPLREPVFRRIWTASLLSNFGQLILGVGAAWEMVRLTPSAGMVALVQTALMAPLMLVAVPAGALADMFDRRRIAMTGLAFSAASATLLTLLSSAGHATPWLILAFCFLIGSGVALYSPAWQSSITEQVGAAHLPAAIALGTISYNVARSFGPALGGAIVLAAGAQAAFAVNAFCYLPLLLTFFLWRRTPLPSRLPPEQMHRAIVSGIRYALHAAPIRIVLVRAFLFGLAGASAAALAPLIAKTLLGGDAAIYGLLLGASGVGAVAGALLVGPLRDHFGTQGITAVLSLLGGGALALAGASRALPLTCFALALAGGANILTIALFNVSVQLSAPRWVTARALSLFSSALTGGIAIGAALWGAVAVRLSVDMALYLSGVAMAVMPLIGWLFPLPALDETDVEPFILGNEPEVGLALTRRSGPVIIEIDYDVDPARARDFYGTMLEVQRTRLRNGGFNWSIARDIADPALWTERYQCPTWGDYLHMRERFTQADKAVQSRAGSFNRSPGGLRVRRRLERPFGSVRWRSDSPDPRQEGLGYIGP